MKTLEITTKIGCINDCVYCPQDVLIKNYVGNLIMSLDQFKAILVNIPKDVVLDFTGFCEPFLNSFASRMMRYAINEGYEAMLITTMTGFTKEDVGILEGLKFRHVLIHEFEGVEIDGYYEYAVQLLKNSVVTERFERFRLPEQNRYSRASNLWDVEHRKGAFKCGWSERDFFRNVVLPNGDVYLCCMDYGLKEKIGNLNETNYNDLDRQRIVEKSFYYDSDIICRKCEIARYE